MLDPDIILRDTEHIAAEMRKRGAAALYAEFLDLHRVVEQRGGVNANAVLQLARSVTLSELREGIATGDPLVMMIDKYLRLPNFTDASVPECRDGSGDRIVRDAGKSSRSLPKVPKTYDVLGKELGIFQPEAANKVADDGYPVLFGMGASLDRALSNFMLDVHKRNGYAEILAPTVINERSMFTTGAFPQFGDVSFRIEGSDLYLNPTIELQTTNLLRDAHFDGPNGLPFRVVGYSRSFRLEDRPSTLYTLLREFGKIEMFTACRQEDWRAEFEHALDSAEEVLRLLELPYRKVLLCTTNMGIGYYLAYDFYVFAPGSGSWWEVASCSANTDYAARAMNATYRDETGRVRYVYTSHVTGFALPRLVSAIIENYQLDDDTIAIPAALQPYLGEVQQISVKTQPFVPSRNGSAR